MTDDQNASTDPLAHLKPIDPDVSGVKMTYKQACNLAIDALTDARRRWAFDFNIGRIYKIVTPHTANATRNYLTYTKAIKILEESKNKKQ